MRNKKPIEKSVLEELYINKRLTVKEVSEQLGVNFLTVRRYMKIHGIASRNVNHENSLISRLGITEEDFRNELLNKYINDSLSIVKISEEYNVSHVIISRYLKKYKINIREQSFYVSGNKNPKWNGGVTFHSEGYALIYCPDHPNPTRDKYVYEHRLVMEKSIGRYLLPEEHIHHLNGIKSDNRIENLEILSNSEHQRIHGTTNGKDIYKRLTAGKIRKKHKDQIEMKIDEWVAGI